MGFEPTTPCLQTVRLGVVNRWDLEPHPAERASKCLLWPGYVVRVWPGRRGH